MLAYADDICTGILLECKELTAILQNFNSVLTEYSMKLSAEKSFWTSLGCTVKTSDKGAIQLPCGSIEHAKSNTYSSV